MRFLANPFLGSAEGRPAPLLRVAWRFPSFVCSLPLALGWRGGGGGWWVSGDPVPSAGLCHRLRPREPQRSAVLSRSPCCSHTRCSARRSFFRSVRCLCDNASGTSGNYQSRRAGGKFNFFFYIYMCTHTEKHIHPHLQIIACLYICTYNSTQSFGSLFSETIFLHQTETACLSRKKKKRKQKKPSLHHSAKFIPQPQPCAEPVPFIHPCPLPAPLSNQRSCESIAGFLAMKFICLIPLQQIKEA